MNEDLLREIEKMGGPVATFSPFAMYNSDGDCLEFHLSNESCYAKRLDGWVTVYVGEDSGDVVGGVLKGVRGSLLRRFPGIRVEIEDKAVSVAVLIRAAAYESEDAEKQRTYRDILDKTKDLRAEVDELCA